jgi:hypothetical protein
VLTTRHGVKVLGASDLDAFQRLTAIDPVVNVFAAHRARVTNLEPRWLGGEIWGRFDGGDLRSACHVGANLVPVQAHADDARVFAERALARPAWPPIPSRCTPPSASRKRRFSRIPAERRSAIHGGSAPHLRGERTLEG